MNKPTRRDLRYSHCPYCGAGPWEFCKNSKGKSVFRVHRSREQEYWQEDFVDGIAREKKAREWRRQMNDMLNRVTRNRPL